MAHVSQNHPVFTVIVRTRMKPELQQQFIDLCKQQVIPNMATLPGFISHNLHRSHDGTEVINYLQWTARENHLNCASHPNWEEWAKDMMAFIKAHHLTQEVQTFEIVATRELEPASKN